MLKAFEQHKTRNDDAVQISKDELEMIKRGVDEMKASLADEQADNIPSAPQNSPRKLTT